jgi:aerobic carbon-monoxide dehydrogenase large subunit
MANESLRFGSGREALRSEDDPLLCGRARFADDVELPGQGFAAFARAQIAHGEIRGIDVSRAAAMPGVLAVFAGIDLSKDGLGAIPPAVVLPKMVAVPMPPLAVGRVRYVGEPLAIVVAETAAQAEDATAAIEADIDELPAASTVERALGAPGNVALHWTDCGNSGDAAGFDAAFARAAHVEKVRLLDTRLAPSAMEPRAAIGAWDAKEERYTLVASTQGVAVVRRLLAEGVFHIAPEKLRVLTYDVGGGFGMKVQPYAEYAALLYAARRVGRPVKWCASRVESFLTDTHGRDGVLEGELALDANGKFLALRMKSFVGIGAYTSTFSAIFATNNTKNCLSSVYAIPALAIDVKMVLTNAAPLGPYRGAGRPEAILILERLIDRAARAMSIDRVELRRRNFIPPSAMPYRAPNAQVYDSGEFEAAMDKALALSDWKGFPARRAASERAGRLRGIGMGCFLEVAGGILDETVDLRFEGDGRVALRTGVQAMGQGHLSTFVPLVAAKLGVPREAVRLVQGDSDQVPVGTPSVASRSMMMAGSATVVACDQAVEKGRGLAAEALEAAAADLEFSAGRYRVVGTDRALPILEIAKRNPGALDAVAKFVSPQMSFPNGCHVCEVEIDPDTGVVTVVGYAAVDDVGTIVHETIVEGQIHGGIAQGLGQVLGEEVVYGEDGQLLSASFMDYMIPRANDLPPLKVAHHSVPCTTNPLGVKGAGEAGAVGAPAAVVNAVCNALGVRHLDMPLTPEKVWSSTISS